MYDCGVDSAVGACSSFVMAGEDVGLVGTRDGVGSGGGRGGDEGGEAVEGEGCVEEKTQGYGAHWSGRRIGGREEGVDGVLMAD